MTIRHHEPGRRIDWFWLGIAFVAGFAVAVLAGARPGEQVRPSIAGRP